MDPDAARFTGARFSKAFARDLKRAPSNVRESALSAVDQLVKGAPRGAQRMHSLKGYDPKIYKIDILGKAWQVSFSIDGTVLVLRRLATHKTMDRDPQ